MPQKHASTKVYLSSYGCGVMVIVSLLLKLLISDKNYSLLSCVCGGFSKSGRISDCFLVSSCKAWHFRAIQFSWPLQLLFKAFMKIYPEICWLYMYAINLVEFYSSKVCNYHRDDKVNLILSSLQIWSHCILLSRFYMPINYRNRWYKLFGFCCNSHNYFNT